MVDLDNGQHFNFRVMYAIIPWKWHTNLSICFLGIGMALMGMTFGPMAALLPELFPTEVRYSGASLAYNIASIIGATIAAMISLKINALYGLMGVGIYLAINAFLTLLALLASKETKNVDLTQI